MLIFSKSFFFKSMHTPLEKSDRIMRYFRYPLDPPLSFCSLRDLKEKSSWHRSCYKNAVHSGMLKRAKERYERHLEGPNEMKRKQFLTGRESQQVTRSSTIPYDKEVCFFCEGKYCTSKYVNE